MLAFDPAQRPSMQDIKSHSWYLDANTATLEEVQHEFMMRKQKVDEEAEAKR